MPHRAQLTTPTWQLCRKGFLPLSGVQSLLSLSFYFSSVHPPYQSGDEVIAVLKAQNMDVALLEAKFGSVNPGDVLRSSEAPNAPRQYVYEEPMGRGKKQTNTKIENTAKVIITLRTLNALRQLMSPLTDELKLLLHQEKACWERKEEDHESEVFALKFKCFALLVIDKQHCMTNQHSQQSKRIQALKDIAPHAQQELNSTQSRAKGEELKVLHLEEAMTAKLANEDAQNQQLRQRLAILSQQLDKLDGTRGALQRAEEELQELRDRLSHRGDRCATSPGLLSEVEQLRKRVVEMEGKDEELVRMGDQCRDLDRKLGRESSQSRSLKAEVDKLNGRISDLDRLEEALGKSKRECDALQGSLDKERASIKQLSAELETLRQRVRELEANEGQMERSELALRQDFAKLRTLTVVLVEERKNMAERLRRTEEKLQEKTDNLQLGERHSMSTATDKLTEESHSALRSKAELEERIQSVAKERDELRSRLRMEEDKTRDLQSRVTTMKKGIEVIEVKRGEFSQEMKSPLLVKTNHCYQQDDNKVKELTQEVARLRRRLMQKGVVESELMKAEEDFESLKKRWSKEHERARALADELEESKRELSKYQQGEKENNQEHQLLRRLQEEQVKAVLLRREVEALKEKVQKLMVTEESLCRVQMDSSTLKKRLTQQEVKNRELAREMQGLTHEVERYRQFSKSLRPGITGRRFSDLLLSTKEVQTEPTYTLPNNMGLAPLELGSRLHEQIDGEDPKQNKNCVPNQCYSTTLNNTESLDHQNNVRCIRIPSPTEKDNQPPIKGNLLKEKGEVMLARAAGQPLHIKVTPEHGLNTATLEISSSSADNATSYTSTAVIPTSGASPKQRITIIPNAAISPVARSKHSPCSEPVSPPGMTPTMVLPPDSSGSVSPDLTGSPIQMVTVSTGSLESTEVIRQAVFRVGPEKQNSCQITRSNCTGPSIITTEDNKIHIHLGSPCIQSISGITQNQSIGTCHTPKGGARTPVITNGCHVKGSSKITSSITITPAKTAITRQSHITVSGPCD
uniref:Cortactin-binding protein-2 N-terminal domain-containing protein n=1 Tax=Esox lucius TaxID=8010 RepID=A0A3P8YW67_ESOLU